MSKTPHDILIGEKYINKTTGEEKTAWHKVGVAFSLENGGLSGEIVEGITLSGKFIIKERTAKDPGKDAEEA